ncbi:hypothetical protein KVT40_001265 [Elsinoe batatas]|uniref:Apple domain-containing protein n=1 Tax=Elsinoe batatas TaxID=2601811 RepID=A0A8K0LDK9_9PEZI|nr:hypothetical protein KVT40_001265 [Elsinoe batatas]
MHALSALSALAGLSALIAAAPTSLLDKRAACDAEAPGVSGYAFDESSAEGFTGATSFADAANGASVPSGFVSVFTNQQASKNGNDYLGHTLLTSYDVPACAAACAGKPTCQGFNILFERGPSLTPGAACPNPAGVAYIKCVLWGGPLTLDSLTNVGYTNQQFQILIAGSNGYIKTGIVPPSGYSTRQYFSSGAIYAPQYRVREYYSQSVLNAADCAAKCTEHTNWAAGQPGEKPCNFFSTYYQFINNENTLDQLFCHLYDRVLDSSYATEVGQWRGSDWFYTASSYGFSA